MVAEKNMLARNIYYICIIEREIVCLVYIVNVKANYL